MSTLWIMRAVSLRQPQAHLIATGRLQHHSTYWQPSYRGPVVVCSTAKPAGPWRTGEALAVVQLEHAELAPNKRWRWALRLLRRLPAGIAVRGSHKLWKLPAEVEATVRQHLEWAA